MCGEWSGSAFGHQVDPELHVSQFAAACSELIHLYEPEWLRLYVGGSFLNPCEVCPTAQSIILRLASILPGISRITLESRAPLVTSQNLTRLCEAVGGRVELEIGIGLESMDNLIRKVCINKPEGLDDYEYAVHCARQKKIRTLAYVLLKPPFVSENEAIGEAVSTINYALNIGFDAVSVEPVSIQEWSLVEALYLQGLYTPPWLWSVLEVVRRTAAMGEIRVGGCEYYPRPVKVAYNRCQAGPIPCDERVWAVLREYNASHNVSLLDKIHCDCELAWKAELIPSAFEMRARIDHTLKQFDLQSYIHAKQAGMKIEPDSQKLTNELPTASAHM